MTEIHRAGVQHNDFEDNDFRHVLIRGKDDLPIVRIVDFDRSTPHECGVKMPVKMGDYAPSEREFGCGELHDIAYTAGAWTPGERFTCSPRSLTTMLMRDVVYFHLMGHCYSIFRACTRCGSRSFQ